MESDREVPGSEPDNSQQDSGAPAEGAEAGKSGFEVTAGRLEQLIKSMEVLLSDVEQLRSVCSHQATELMATAEDLRQQQEQLKGSYAGLAQDMQEAMDTVEDLLSTKSAFDAKEKLAQKVNRQL